jgi:uncharacterized protein YeaC (DUF1315 family)
VGKSEKRELASRMAVLSAMRSADWQEGVWLDAVSQAQKETGIEALPATCPWTMDRAADQGFWPEQAAHRPKKIEASLEVHMLWRT